MLDRIAFNIVYCLFMNVNGSREQLLDVTRDDIMRVANTYLRPELVEVRAAVTCACVGHNNWGCRLPQLLSSLLNNRHKSLVRIMALMFRLFKFTQLATYTTI